MTRLGVMGGTFDPIHYGHLVAAEEARAQLGLEGVTFVPCRQPPHKKDYRVTDAEHRYAMTLAATCDHPRFTASRIELERPGPSYTIDTLRRLQREHPTAELFFITGADAVRELLTWREPQELAALCRLVAVTRPGYDLGGLERALGELARQVRALEAPGVNVSSTDIRARVARGWSLRYLTPPAVETYIAKHGLYRGDDAEPNRKGGE
ncbi:MAG TPA: nicotinate-nucleotide adenylyltransferase [Armatimonadota bacterium]|nr:nicotinate-nucleotide adenylyltransferase [Armatimonadota bacterium]